MLYSESVGARSAAAEYKSGCMSDYVEGVHPDGSAPHYWPQKDYERKDTNTGTILENGYRD